MNKAVDWIENHPDSPYRLSGCELWFVETDWDGEPMVWFRAKGSYIRPGDCRMFSLKTDDAAGDTWRWRPGDIQPNVRDIFAGGVHDSTYEDPWSGQYYEIDELRL